MKKISTIGIDIPSNGDNYIRLDSISSLSESDIAIISPNFSNTSYSTYEGEMYNRTRGEYEGKKCYNKESSAEMLAHSNHWKTEIPHFLDTGGTLFIILTKKDDFFLLMFVCVLRLLNYMSLLLTNWVLAFFRLIF
jgi:hypothetical protein